MPSLYSHFHGNRMGDNLHQLKSRFNRLFLSFFYNVLCDILRELIFSEVPYHVIQFRLAIPVHDVSRRKVHPAVHPHIQRRIVAIGKSSVRLIKLITGNT